MKSRRPLIVANWKMNGTAELVSQMHESMASLNTANEILICPPVIFLQGFPANERYHLGGQNVSAQSEGAFTGEISASMLRSVGAIYTLVGHSERRSLYGETNEIVAEKALQAINSSLIPIVCVGETLAERQQEKTLQVLANQLDAVYAAHPELLGRSVVAYEPVWAIGTGEAATPEQAQTVHRFIRDHLAQYGADEVNKLRILYGGSVNQKNCAELFAQPDIDGALVGGASLKPAEFSVICECSFV